MRCIVCEKWSLKGICSLCQEKITLFPAQRTLEGMKVWSFYAFSEIEYLLHYKYTPLGAKIFAILARKANAYFKKHFALQEKLYSVGIDDRVQKGYSHTGVILNQMSVFVPIYGELIAQNKISYAGKSLQFRQSHPKGFQTSLCGKNLVILDDVITTGTSLLEAKKVLESQGNQVHFALVLCDARY